MRVREEEKKKGAREMIYRDFRGKKLSLLGFGAMRLPQTEEGTVDEAQVDEMVRYAMEHGVNYYDTAYPYHGGTSEIILGRILKQYPRDRFYLATKYPGHQISSSYDPAAVFEEQLQKCGVDYFDFYLLHNVYENSINTYLDPRWGILEYFKEQKRLGRIRHLGFSSHGSVELLGRFLDICGEDMEFCQIQLNYLDWTLQNGKGKYELLTERGIPVWVMEPVRGGRLAKLDEDSEARMKARRPGESVPAWGFRFLQGLPNVNMILSGMSNLEQMKDNVGTFEAYEDLSGEEKQLLMDIAEGMKNSIPCTGCRYCCDGCPKELDIPMMMSILNEVRFSPAVNVGMRMEALPEEKQPSACIACGKCAKVCPQNIPIPQMMKELAEALTKIPSWAEICRERDEAQRKLKEGK